MNEKEMMKQLQELRAGMKEEEANTFLVQVTNMAEVFYTSAIALTKLCNMFQGKDPQEPEKCEEEDDDWDDDDIEYMDATVLYAVPGKGVQLIEEEEAMSRFPDFEDEQTFPALRSRRICSFTIWSIPGKARMISRLRILCISPEWVMTEANAKSSLPWIFLPLCSF